MRNMSLDEYVKEGYIHYHLILEDYGSVESLLIQTVNHIANAYHTHFVSQRRIEETKLLLHYPGSKHEYQKRIHFFDSLDRIARNYTNFKGVFAIVLKEVCEEAWEELISFILEEKEDTRFILIGKDASKIYERVKHVVNLAYVKQKDTTIQYVQKHVYDYMAKIQCDYTLLATDIKARVENYLNLCDFNEEEVAISLVDEIMYDNYEKNSLFF